MKYNLPKVRGTYRFDAELKNWFDVSAKAEVLFRPADIADLQDFLKQRSENNLDFPLTILGAASNVIIKNVVKGVVIRLSGGFAKMSANDQTLKVGCAALCINTALQSKNYAISGLEFLTGIPGSIGGAVAMNAGCYGSDVSKILQKVIAVDLEGNLVELSNSDCEFSYRKNKAAEDLIFVEAIFEGIESTSEEIDKKINEFTKQRQESQPIRARTGGSTFKNPEPDNSEAKKAWQLIDEAGFRGASCNDAEISQKHCNFMINKNNASAEDLIDLGNRVKKSVKDKTGVNLEWEIKIIE